MDKGGAKVERGYPGPTQGNTKRKMHAGCRNSTLLRRNNMQPYLLMNQYKQWSLPECYRLPKVKRRSNDFFFIKQQHFRRLIAGCVNSKG